jgi:hypothetical protein
LPDDFHLTVGLPDQWRAFGERNRAFLDRFDNLKGILNQVFNRKWSSENPIDRVVFTAGFLTVDDFLELLLVCGNAEATFKPGLLSAESKKEADENYERVKEKYKVSDCEKCGTTRLNFTWTPKDIITMAKEVGMKDYIVPAYYIPMQFTHPSVKGMLGRLQIDESGFTFKPRSDPEMADRIFSAAHALMLEALAVQINHFKLDEDLWNRAEKDYLDMWKRPIGVGKEPASS